MDHDFYEWASDAPLRAPDGFSEAATAAGVAASVAERNEMMAFALRTFSRGHGRLLDRIVSGYEKAKKLQLRGMIAYAVVAVVALVIMLVLSCGGVLAVGFEKVYLLQNTLNSSTSEIISTYVYKMGLISNQYSLSSAIGLFNNVINLALLLLVNAISKKISDTSLI